MTILKRLCNIDVCLVLFILINLFVLFFSKTSPTISYITGVLLLTAILLIVVVTTINILKDEVSIVLYIPLVFMCIYYNIHLQIYSEIPYDQVAKYAFNICKFIAIPLIIIVMCRLKLIRGSSSEKSAMIALFALGLLLYMNLSYTICVPAITLEKPTQAEYRIVETISEKPLFSRGFHFINSFSTRYKVEYIGNDHDERTVDELELMSSWELSPGDVVKVEFYDNLSCCYYRTIEKITF